MHSTVRPSDTHKGGSASQQANLNLLYWSDEGTFSMDCMSTLVNLCVLFIAETSLSADLICGKCHVICGDDIEEDITEYSLKGVHNFYFMEVSDNWKDRFIF